MNPSHDKLNLAVSIYSGTDWFDSHVEYCSSFIFVHKISRAIGHSKGMQDCSFEFVRDLARISCTSMVKIEICPENSRAAECPGSKIGIATPAQVCIAFCSWPPWSLDQEQACVSAAM